MQLTAGLGDYLYKKYKNIDIFFLMKKKVKVCTSNIEVANLIALDSDLNTNFPVYIPSEMCVKEEIEKLRRRNL